jgi:DNA-binding NtrC family response regulator
LNNADLLEPGPAELVVSVLANNPGNMRIIGTSSLEPRDWQNHPVLPFQIATITIHLPPLVERRDDIPLLAQWFLEQQNARALAEDKKSAKPQPNVAIAQRTGFAADALDLLTQYHWPGNLDELVQVVADSHANAMGTLIRANDLPVRLHQAADAQSVHYVEERIDLDNYLQSLELELIQRALKAARGNKAKAARLLGMTRARLYRRLEQLGLIDLPTAEFGTSKHDPEASDDTPDFRELDAE